MTSVYWLSTHLSRCVPFLAVSSLIRESSLKMNTVQDDFCLLTLYSPKKTCAIPGSFILDQRVLAVSSLIRESSSQMNTVEDDFCFLTLYSLKQMCGISGSCILDQRVILANEQLNTVEDYFCLLTLYSPKINVCLSWQFHPWSESNPRKWTRCRMTSVYWLYNHLKRRVAFLAVSSLIRESSSQMNTVEDFCLLQLLFMCSTRALTLTKLWGTSCLHLAAWSLN